MKTLYEQLGVTSLASQTPNNPQCPGGERAQAEYLALQNAYRTLSNVQSRAEYDRTLLQLCRSGQIKSRPAIRVYGSRDSAFQGEVA